MPDLTLVCQNCHNEFVFSEGEQKFYADKQLENPKDCPICRSIKAQEKRIPAKPTPPTPASTDPFPPKSLPKLV